MKTTILFTLLISFLTQSTGQFAPNILNAHNQIRQNVKPPAKIMPNLQWDPLLERVADNFASKCIWKHNSDRTKQARAIGSKFNYIGENLYVSSKTDLTGKEPAISWGSQAKNYNLDTNSCNGVCGHYTQVVWSKTTSLGCGAHVCKNVKGVSFCSKGCTLVVCNYGVGGNYVGQKPYERKT